MLRCHDFRFKGSSWCLDNQKLCTMSQCTRSVHLVTHSIIFISWDQPSRGVVIPLHVWSDLKTNTMRPAYSPWSTFSVLLIIPPKKDGFVCCSWKNIFPPMSAIALASAITQYPLRKMSEPCSIGVIWGRLRSFFIKWIAAIFFLPNNVVVPRLAILACMARGNVCRRSGLCGPGLLQSTPLSPTLFPGRIF